MPNYDLRKKNKNVNYYEGTGSDSENSDLTETDSDYERKTPRRRARSLHDVEILMDYTGVDSCVREVARRRGRSSRRRIGGAGEETARPRSRTPGRRRRYGFRSQHEAGSSRRNRKMTILSWLVDLKIIQDGAKVWYVDQTRERVVLEGHVRVDCIQCGCCNQEVSVWKFEIHARSDLRRPYENIFIAETQHSLLQCQIEAWRLEAVVAPRGFNLYRPQEDAADIYDDVCTICADGGELLCCENCPSTFHYSCMGLEAIPQEEWLCPYCVCKFCGNGAAAGYLQECIQCEKKFHWQCFCEREHLDLNYSYIPYCGSSCREIHEKLLAILDVKHIVEDKYSWSLLHYVEPESGAGLNEKERIENNSKLAIAWRILDETFEPNIDRHTGVNVTQSVVYHRGSNLNRLNFSGFYTAILEGDDEIISVASLRIHGSELAEMPFMATREAYRKKKMSTRLQAAIESVLSFLKIKKVVIPSVPHLVWMWTRKYEFSPMDDESMRELFQYNTLMFPGTVRLQKALIRGNNAGASPPAAVQAREEENNENQTDNVPPESTPAMLIDLNAEPPQDNEEQIDG